MCGILGVRADIADQLGGSFAAAVAAIEWRGPDGTRSLQAGGWRLAVTRLTITDSRAPQPLQCAESGRVALCNGAFTSAAAERQELGAERFRTGNDAELPLVRLRRDGVPIGARTCGHYALAVVDPSNDELWLARDPMGEKPLHVVSSRRGGRVLAFASSLTSLAKLGFALAFDDRQLALFMRHGFEPRARLRDERFVLDSDLSGVFRAEGDGPLRPEALRGRGFAPDHVAGDGGLRARVTAAVARCADSEQAVGLALSGGIDSSVLALSLPQPSAVRAYNVQAKGRANRERAAARVVAQVAGVELVPIEVGPDVLSDLPRLVRCAGVPLGDPSVLAVHALCRRAAADGVRVLLSGEGADELFLGYRRQRLARWLPSVGSGLVPAPDPYAMTTAARLRRALRAESPHQELLSVAPPGFGQAVLVPDLLRAPPLLAADPSETGLQRAARIDREVYLRRDLLPKLDVASLAAAVEGRCPFLDPEVLAAPEARSPRPDHLGKRALRQAFAELPAPVRRLRKTGFGLPLDDWWGRDPLLPDLLRDRRTLERPHLHKDGVLRLLGQQQRGAVRLGHAFFLLAALEPHLRAVEEAAATCRA